MGLTAKSVGKGAIDLNIDISRKSENDKIIALAGNPNVGKSTVFNALTGMDQHTGNWPGKTVATAKGYFSTEQNNYILVDLPGTYSLIARSKEEEVARDFICNGNHDAVVVVCDATCLERNLNLALQILNVSQKVLICVNLMDEAEHKGIEIDLKELSDLLGVKVVGISARKKKTLKKLYDALDELITSEPEKKNHIIRYNSEIEQAINMLSPAVKPFFKDGALRHYCIRLLEGESSALTVIKDDTQALDTLDKANLFLQAQGITPQALCDIASSAVLKLAERISHETVNIKNDGYNAFDRRIDKLLTGRLVGYPLMFLLLLFVLWLTVVGANYPSQVLSSALFWLEDKINSFLLYINLPDGIRRLLVEGVWRVPMWVVSVMLPPMAIFFPLFTLLEDLGFLPRVAFNLDKTFKKCGSCGKQALPMCIGLGCNAAGVVGCRIIDSQRERTAAILTNNFMPCNGRFPTIIALITMFFIGGVGASGSGILSAMFLTSTILLGIFSTFFVTYMLSKTILKGMPSSFILELPSYRRPQICKTLVRSIFDRTIFVLGRALAVAVPAGVVIWLLANIHINDLSLLTYCCNALDPFGRLLGLDGVILMAFILGFPANEVVIPIIIMAYTMNGSLQDYDSLIQLKGLLVDNGWTIVTAICTVIFSLMHWPCSTTLLTIKKETGSIKWTILAAIIPTALGMTLCLIINLVSKLFI